MVYKAMLAIYKATVSKSRNRIVSVMRSWSRNEQALISR